MPGCTIVSFWWLLFWTCGGQAIMRLNPHAAVRDSILSLHASAGRCERRAVNTFNPSSERWVGAMIPLPAQFRESTSGCRSLPTLSRAHDARNLRSWKFSVNGARATYPLPPPCACAFQKPTGFAPLADGAGVCSCFSSPANFDPPWQWHRSAAATSP